jgi:hypothetical protein
MRVSKYGDNLQNNLHNESEMIKYTHSLTFYRPYQIKISPTDSQHLQSTRQSPGSGLVYKKYNVGVYNDMNQHFNSP